MTKELLLKESTIFKGSNIIDNIRQSLIDLETEHPLEDVDLLLKESFTFLDKKIDIPTATELFSLIISCFSKYLQLFTTNLQYLLESSKLNSNHIIIAAASISYMLNSNQDIKIEGYESFASDLFSQILPQITKSDNYDSFKIYNCKIPFQFRAD